MRESLWSLPEWAIAKNFVMSFFFKITPREMSYGKCFGRQGKILNISPGSPNIILRLEGGIVSYLADIDRTNNPYEVGLDWMVNLDQKMISLAKMLCEKLVLRGQKRNY